MTTPSCIDIPSIADIEREIGLRGSFYDFVLMAWQHVEGSAYSDNWHIESICQELEDLYFGKTKKLIINIPPGCMKSMLVCIFFPVWCWIRSPDSRWLATSFDAGLTWRDSGKSLALMQSDWFKARWGDRVRFATKDPAKGEYQNTAGGWRFATSVEGKTTGWHPDFILVDDPLKPKDVTKAGLEAVISWWRGTMATRGRNMKERRICVIMQRLDENDLVGYLLANEKGWRCVCYPMRFDPSRASPGDPRTEEGQLLWEDRYPEEAVSDLEIQLGPRNASAQLGQDPHPEGGTLFERNWFGNRYTELPEKPGLWVQSWDCTFKDLSSSDYVVGQIWASIGGGFYLVDQLRAKMGFLATCQAIRDWRTKYPKARTILIEDKANGSAVIEVLGKEFPGLLAVEPEGGKVVRANAVTGYWKAGNVWLPNAHWVPEFIENHVKFPAARYDDEIDTMSQALVYLGNKRTSLAAAMEQAKKNGLLR